MRVDQSIAVLKPADALYVETVRLPFRAGCKRPDFNSWVDDRPETPPTQPERVFDGLTGLATLQRFCGHVERRRGAAEHLRVPRFGPPSAFPNVSNRQVRRVHRASLNHAVCDAPRCVVEDIGALHCQICDLQYAIMNAYVILKYTIRNVRVGFWMKTTSKQHD